MYIMYVLINSWLFLCRLTPNAEDDRTHISHLLCELHSQQVITSSDFSKVQILHSTCAIMQKFYLTTVAVCIQCAGLPSGNDNQYILGGRPASVQNLPCRLCCTSYCKGMYIRLYIHTCTMSSTVAIPGDQLISHPMQWIENQSCNTVHCLLSVGRSDTEGGCTNV